MPARRREIVIATFPDVQSFDVVGPLEVFHAAQQLIYAQGGGHCGYRVSVLAREAGPLLTSGHLSLMPDAVLSDAPRPIDTLIVAGGRGRRQAAADQALIGWLAVAGRAARRVASVCTGAFLLAEAGLLDGRHATTHRAHAEDLAKRYPAVNVDAEALVVADGPVWTSGGVTAGIDLALAMLEDDIDRDHALTVARDLVTFVRRPGRPGSVRSVADF